MSLPCIACGKGLEDAIPGTPEHPVENQPYQGTVFTSHGQYGSTVFDSMTGEFLEINVCDECLKINRDMVLIGRVKTTQEVTYSKWYPNE